MRPIKPNSRRRSLGGNVLLAIGAISLGGVCTVGLLAVAHVIDPASLMFWRSKPGIPKGWVGVPLSSRTIPAYTQVTREYLMNAKTGAPELKWYPPDRVPKGILSDPSQVLNRVTAHEISAVYFFKESDFLPVGTHPGLVAGTPQGKRAITLEASKLKGVFGLKEGDRIDMLASIPVDMPGAGRGNSGPMGTSVMATPDVLLVPRRCSVRPLVQDGVVVSPVTARMVPVTSSSMMNGATTRNVRVDEIVLAVAPEEVSPLAEAMDLKYEITCVARSGRPAPVAPPAAPAPVAPQTVASQSTQSPSANAKAAAAGHTKEVSRAKTEPPAKERVAVDGTPGLNPMADLHYMEVRVGSKTQYLLFNAQGSSPVVAGENESSAQPAAAAPTNEQQAP